MGIKHVSGLGVLALVGYDTMVRPRLLDWGSTPDERRRPLPGDEIVTEVVPAGMRRHTRAVTIDAPPEAIWPWLVQIGDRRAGFYSYDWFERATGTVHYIEGTRSATRIHPELQDLKTGDHIDTGSIGPDFRIGSPVSVLEPNRALVMGTWAFVLEPLADGQTRLLVREPYPGWIRLVVPVRFGLLRAIGAAIDYMVGEPLHFVMERKMMFGLKQRAEGAAAQPPTSAGRRGDDRVTRQRVCALTPRANAHNRRDAQGGTGPTRSIAGNTPRLPQDHGRPRDYPQPRRIRGVTRWAHAARSWR